MSTTNVSKNPESDILTVIRELDRSQPVKPSSSSTEAAAGSDAAQSPNPTKLLESLQNKRRLIGLLDGYGDVGGISEMKEKLNEAISDLEVILEATA